MTSHSCPVIRHVENRRKLLRRAFIFAGANIDAFAEAGGVGIAASMTMSAGPASVESIGPCTRTLVDRQSR